MTLRPDEGITGIGYAGFASQLLTKGLKEVVDAVCEQVMGDNHMETEALAQRLLRVGGGGAPAFCPRTLIDLRDALVDGNGRHPGVGRLGRGARAI